jgi:hypothetical protein
MKRLSGLILGAGSALHSVAAIQQNQIDVAVTQVLGTERVVSVPDSVTGSSGSQW